MLVTGVDVVRNRPRRWRVENSWGDEKCGRKGLFVMNDSWFDEQMFGIAVRRSALPKPLQRALKLPSIVLPRGIRWARRRIDVNWRAAPVAAA